MIGAPIGVLYKVVAENENDFICSFTCAPELCRRYSYSTSSLTLTYLQDIKHCFLELKENLRKRKLGYFTIKYSTDVGSLPLGGILSLSPLCLPLSSFYQSCSVPNMFTVFSMKLHCKRITLLHCSSGLNTDDTTL